ncbi:MAG: chemotaxis protein CheW [Verrucomicrobiota bacterium]
MNGHATQSQEGRLVATFLLGDASFGLDAHEVQEVTRVGDVTAVHHAPPYVVGIRNLRGRIVTIIDLGARLEQRPVVPGPENRIMIVEWQGEQIGLLVDNVTGTMTASADSIVPPPPNLHGIQGKNLVGVCRGGERLVGLLDLAGVLHANDPLAGTRDVASSTV